MINRRSFLTGILSSFALLFFPKTSISQTGRFKVFVDPYIPKNGHKVTGYRGSDKWDAGMFYCPYIPLQMDDTSEPKIKFKNRYEKS